MYKYKIKDFLDNLPVKQYKLLARQIPKEIGVSYNTFKNYSKILKNSKQDIPYAKVRKLEILFGMQNNELTNLNIKSKHYLELINKTNITLKTRKKQKAA
jgi:hypothetical protein